MARLSAIALALCATWAPIIAAAKVCEAHFAVETQAAHGTLPTGTLLNGVIRFNDDKPFRNGSETVSYLDAGTMSVTAPDGTAVSGILRAVHITRTPYFADYASFDVKDVSGDLGSVSSYEDPMLVTLFAKGETLTTFDLPTDTAGWGALSKRRVFQVHTPNTMAVLPGRVTQFDVSCG